MLKIRGEVKKSDTVATLLATKALQEMVAVPWTHASPSTTELELGDTVRRSHTAERCGQNSKDIYIYYTIFYTSGFHGV